MPAVISSAATAAAAATVTTAATPLVVTVYLPCSSPLASNATTAVPGSTTAAPSVFNLFYIGLILALGQSVLNGFNYMFNKVAQNRVARTGRSAAECSFRYCCEPVWWLSLVLSTLRIHSSSSLPFNSAINISFVSFTSTHLLI